MAQFHERGFNAAAVKDITDRAGVPKGSFYNHFEIKEAHDRLRRLRQLPPWRLRLLHGPADRRDSSDGGYAEFVIARPSGLVAVPDGLDPVEAAPLLCAGLTVFNGSPQSSACGWLRSPAAKEELARQLGAQEYIDSAAVDPGEALQALGGATVIVATAASGASMTPLVDGLAVPIEVSTGSLVFGGRSIEGSLTGTPSENEENLAFSLANNVPPTPTPG